jgi:bla regulator protein BlaR1
VNLTYMSPLANHLWQTTLFAAVAGMLTLLLRKNRARARHWVWLAASWKFLVPFSVLMSVGSHMHWPAAPQATQSNLSVVIDEVSQPFTAPAASSVPVTAAPPAASSVPALLWTIWACGFLGISCSWWVRWRRIRAAVHAGSPVHLELPIRTVSSPTLLEPGVFGMFRPVLLLPEGILGRMTAAQLKGVVAHELCHVYYRDNLIAAVHMFVETVFWFHPVVWWIGRRMVEERELACDEEVLRLGNEPRVYAESLLTICRLSVESRLPCVAGVTGPNLKLRIRTILNGWPIQQISPARKAVLALAGFAAVVGPLAIGMLHAPRLGAQSSKTPIPQFEVVSVKPCTPSGRTTWGNASPGRFTSGCWPLANADDHTGLIQQAWNRYAGGHFNPMRILTIEGGPAWIHSTSFNIEAKAEGQPSPEMMNGPMMQAVLEDRFHLKIHREMREGEVYALILPRGAAKLKSFQPGSCVPAASPRPPLQPGQQYCRLVISTQSFDAQGISLTDAAGLLSLILDRPVIDRTGIAGSFEIHLEFSPDPLRPRFTWFASPMPPTDLTAPRPDTADDQDRPTVFQAVEQLGLRLTPARGPIEVFVIDHVEMPSEN